ncbi:MAG: hypothetical protein PHQ35_11065 [Phycisphaerae bacterium]|nr:hypothetical protein [Phycisphaerae bacterium]
MARKQRFDADYFPFIAKDGRTLFLLESKYKCLGTGFFTNVLRLLTLTPNHHIRIVDESDRMEFFARVKIDDQSGAEMLEIMLKTGKLHRKLWEDYGVIYCPDLITSLGPLYEKRSNKIISDAEIMEMYPKMGQSAPETPYKVPGNTQSKVKERKEKETKEKERETPPTSGKTRSDAVHPKYGVPMNAKRYETLCDEYDKSTVDEYVKRAVNYVAAKGKVPYKDYAAAAANFMSRDNVPKKIKSTGAADEIELMKAEPVGTLTPEETQAMKLKAFSRSRDGPNIDF